MKFSKNGKYLATAGQDTLVRVWEVVLQRDERGLPAATPSSPAAPRGAPSGDGAAGAGGAPASGGVGEGRDGCEGGAAAADGVLLRRCRVTFKVRV